MKVAEPDLRCPSSSQSGDRSCNRTRASTGTEGHALDPRMTPSNIAQAAWALKSLLIFGAVAVVAARPKTAATAIMVSAVRMNRRPFLREPHTSSQTRSARYSSAMQILPSSLTIVARRSRALGSDVLGFPR
jgi:hypothetical protein